MASSLKSEFQYYLDHQEEFLKQYAGKVLVIKNYRIIGVFETEIEAIKETSKSHAMGTFLVQKCEPGTDAYSQVFHSRVAFA